MLLSDDLEEDELKRNSGGVDSDAEEEKDEVRWYCACLSRLGLLCRGDLMGDEDLGSGEERRWRMTKDGQSLSLRIEKTRSLY